MCTSGIVIWDIAVQPLRPGGLIDATDERIAGSIPGECILFIFLKSSSFSIVENVRLPEWQTFFFATRVDLVWEYGSNREYEDARRLPGER